MTAGAALGGSVDGGPDEFALDVHSVSKTFPGGRGLKDVDLRVRRGEIHALLGQNGSGKSTFIKILAGVYTPDPGSDAECGGESFELGSASAARAAGIRFVHQDLGLVADLDLVDNLALGRPYTSKFWLSDRRERSAARALLSRFRIDVDPATRLGSLSQARQSMVAIARALDDVAGGGHLIVFDEPTASLTSRDVSHLFELIRQLRDEGNSILYVTHRLSEVFEIADTVTVLRDARRVATVPVSTLDHDALVELIVGRSVSAFYPATPDAGREVVLDVEGLSGDTVHDVSLQLHAGEIAGVAGLVGSGYEELLFLIGGGTPRSGGTVTVTGPGAAPENVPDGDPHGAIAAGVVFAPADRKRLSAIPEWSLRENITLPALKAWRGIWMSDGREAADSAGWLRRLNVDFSPAALFSTLSGGNQQRVVLARWLRTGARVLLLQEPTSGVDTGAKQAIYAALSDAALGGTAVLMSSSDAEELCAVCDRVFVLNDGNLEAVLDGPSLTVDALLAACMKPARSRNDLTQSQENL